MTWVQDLTAEIRADRAATRITHCRICGRPFSEHERVPNGPYLCPWDDEPQPKKDDDEYLLP